MTPNARRRMRSKPRVSVNLLNGAEPARPLGFQHPVAIVHPPAHPAAAAQQSCQIAEVVVGVEQPVAVVELDFQRTGDTPPRALGCEVAAPATLESSLNHAAPHAGVGVGVAAVIVPIHLKGVFSSARMGDPRPRQVEAPGQRPAVNPV